MDAIMDRLRGALKKAQPANDQEYERITENEHEHEERDGEGDDSTLAPSIDDTPFSWLEYGVFLMLGIAMLWAWYSSFLPPPRPAISVHSSNR
jgi:equilibrative nucleoside transporter 1/2/3